MKNPYTALHTKMVWPTTPAPQAAALKLARGEPCTPEETALALDFMLAVPHDATFSLCSPRR